MAHQEYCILALIVAAMALYAFLNGRIQSSMWMLFFASLTLRVFIAIQDPYLHDWDERYHGLVAKHFIEHPGRPTLRDQPLLPYEEVQWNSNHVWLHKQPVFLWQMALSMYFLEDDVFAARLPSILMGALMTLLIFRMASLTIHPRAGFIAAFFHTLCFFQIEQTSGVIGMDHNDIAFSFYITISIWAFLEFLDRQSWRWVLLIGVSAGLAVLNKWLPGMIVYGGWCLWLLFDHIARSEGKKRWQAFLLSGFVACLVFIPWQLYIIDRWPDLSAYVYNFNRQHIFLPIEGHAGDTWFHFRMYGPQYGYWSAAFLLVGVIALIRNRRHPAHVYAVFFPILATYIFWTLVQTKSFAYVFYVSPLVWLCVGGGVHTLWQYIETYFSSARLVRLVFCCILLYMGWITLSFSALRRTHTRGSSQFIASYREEKVHDTQIYAQIDSLAPDADIVFNCKSMRYVDAMFYTDKDVYHWWPDSVTIQDLKSRGIHIAALTGFGAQQLPSYILEDKDIQIIPLKQQ